MKEKKPVQSALVYGIQPVEAALKARKNIHKILISKSRGKGALLSLIQLARRNQIPIQYVPPEAITKKAGHVKHQGVLALMSDVRYYSVTELIAVCRSKTELPVLIMLDGIEDGHNAGAIVRSAEAAGLCGIIIPNRRNAALDAVVAKTSAGAIHYITIARTNNLSRAIDELKKNGFWLLGCDETAQKNFWQIPADIPLVILIGGEGKGIRAGLKKKCDFMASIPMFGKVESLNASVAAALFCYEIRRKRIEMAQQKLT